MKRNDKLAQLVDNTTEQQQKLFRFVDYYYYCLSSSMFTFQVHFFSGWHHSSNKCQLNKTNSWPMFLYLSWSTFSCCCQSSILQNIWSLLVVDAAAAVVIFLFIDQKISRHPNCQFIALFINYVTNVQIKCNNHICY